MPAAHSPLASCLLPWLIGAVQQQPRVRGSADELPVRGERAVAAHVPKGLPVVVVDVPFSIGQVGNGANPSPESVPYVLCHSKTSLPLGAPVAESCLSPTERPAERERTNGQEGNMELLKRIQELLRTKEVTADFEADDELSFQARTGPISVRMRITAREEALVVCAHIPIFAPPNARQRMCEALSLANWQLRFARFEMDASDGELRCRADMPLYDAVPTDKQLTRLMYSVWSISEQYAPALVEVMTSDTDPAIAIARVEEPSHTTSERPRTSDLTVN